MALTSFSITASTASGVAPQPVTATVDLSSVITLSAGQTAMNDVHFQWNFGDVPDPNAIEHRDQEIHDPVTEKTVYTNSDQIGPVATHVYRNSGTYTITCTASWWDGSAWIQKTATTSVTIQTPAEAGWEEAYCDANAVDSARTGDINDPFVVLEECKDWLNRGSNRALYIATGTTLSPKTNTIQTVDTGTRTSFTLSLVVDGTTYGPTGSITVAGLVAADIETALYKLTNSPVKVGDVAVVSGGGTTWTVTFKGRLADVALAAMTFTGTGGAGGSCVVATAGGADEDAQCILFQNTDHIRVMKYTPGDATSGSNPVLQLSSAASGKAVVHLKGSSGADQATCVQRLAIMGTLVDAVTTFTLVVDGVTTAAITYSSTPATTAANIKAAIEAVVASTITATVVTTATTGVQLFTVSFGGAAANTYIPLMTGVTSNDPASVVEVAITTNGSANHSVTQDIVIDHVDLDANGTTSSIGYKTELATSVVNKIGLLRCRVFGYTLQGVLTSTAWTSVAAGPSDITFMSVLFEADPTSAGHTLALSSQQYAAVIACSFRNGGTDPDLDHHISLTEPTAFTPTEPMSDIVLRWNGFISAVTRNSCIEIDRHASGVVIAGNSFTGTRRAFHLGTDTGTLAASSNILFEGNKVFGMGCSGQTGSWGVWLKYGEEISIRNNLFYENGYIDGVAQTFGEDIYLESIADGAGQTYIEHNSFFRSTVKAGAAFIRIASKRPLKLYNNAMDYRGIPKNGTTSVDRAFIRFDTGKTDPLRDQRCKIDITGATSGSFSVKYAGGLSSTGLITYNAIATEVKTALETIAALTGNIDVSGAEGGPWTVTFINALSSTAVSGVLSTGTTNTLNNSGTHPVHSTTVTAAAGTQEVDGNVYFAPNLVLGGLVKAWVTTGAAQIPFDSDTAIATWKNVGNLYAADVWDVNGIYGDTEFRNPVAGNFKFNATDTLAINPMTATNQGVRFDAYRSVRSYDPDAGAFEYTGISSLTAAYNYQPVALTDLPVASARDYRSGDVQYILMNEPVLASEEADGNDVDNRPHKNLAYRDNVVGAAVDAILEDINVTFCQAPQPGSEYLSPHTSIQSFMGVSFNPDGTLRPDVLDTANLPFLRINGTNEMLADLNVGSNKIVNVATAVLPTDGPPLTQVLQRKGDSATNNKMLGALDMGSFRIKFVGAATAGTDAPQFQQVISVYNADIKQSVLSLGAHTWNTGTYTGSTSVQNTDGTGRINCSAVPATMDLYNNGTVWFDGHYVRVAGTTSVTDGHITHALSNSNPITQASGNRITNLAVPVYGSDAANKIYVDEQTNVSFDLHIDDNASGTASQTVQNLKPGKWLVYVSGITAEAGGGDVTIDYLLSPTNGTPVHYLNHNADTNLRFPFTGHCVVTVPAKSGQPEKGEDLVLSHVGGIQHFERWTGVWLSP